MVDFSNFQFLTPGWLLLLPLVGWLLWLLRRYYSRQSMWRQLCDPLLLDYMLGGYGTSKELRWRSIALAFLLCAGIVAMAGPSWREHSNPLLESAAARVLVLDLSRAMLVKDIKPDRMTQALKRARQIVSADFAGETGLVVFAGSSFVVSPLSRDANTLLAFLDALVPQTMPQDGGRLDLAIDSARQLLTASIAKRGQILVITSGRIDIQKTIEAVTAASLQGNRLSLLAIGSREGGPLHNDVGGLLRDEDGRVKLAKTDFKALQQITQIGKGVFLQVSPSIVDQGILGLEGDGSSVLDSLESLDDSLKTPTNEGIWLVWMMLPIAILMFRKNVLWIVLVAIVYPGDSPLYAMDLNSLWQHHEQRAFDAYQQGDFERAAELSGNPLMRGAAYYRSNNFSSAVEAFAQQNSAQALYNQGNALVRMKQFEKAITAYQRAIALLPSLGNARFNLKLLETYLAQQDGNAVGDEDGDDSGDTDAEELESADARSRAGNSGERTENPADSEQPGPGVGNALQSAEIELLEEFNANDAELEQLVIQEFAGQTLPEAELIDRWIDSLPQASSDLFKRKFQRDYNRQRDQSR